MWGTWRAISKISPSGEISWRWEACSLVYYLSRLSKRRWKQLRVGLQMLLGYIYLFFIFSKRTIHPTNSLSSYSTIKLYQRDSHYTLFLYLENQIFTLNDTFINIETSLSIFSLSFTFFSPLYSHITLYKISHQIRNAPLRLRTEEVYIYG